MAWAATLAKEPNPAPFSGASTALLLPPRPPPPQQRPSSVGSCCFTQNVGRVSGSESPNGPSSGVIITSLGGDTLCPSRHLVQPFLERGMQWWSQPVWTGAESLSPQLADLFHRRSRGHGRWSRSGLRGAKDAVGRGGQRTRGSRDAETTLRIAGFTPLALSKPAVVAEDLLYR